MRSGMVIWRSRPFSPKKPPLALAAHADHGELGAVDHDRLPHGLAVREERFGDAGPDHGHARAALPFLGREDAAGGQFARLDGQGMLALAPARFMLSDSNPGTRAVMGRPFRNGGMNSETPTSSTVWA